MRFTRETSVRQALRFFKTPALKKGALFATASAQCLHGNLLGRKSSGIANSYGDYDTRTSEGDNTCVFVKMRAKASGRQPAEDRIRLDKVEEGNEHEPTISNDDGTEMFMFSPIEMVQMQIIMIPQEPIFDDAEKDLDVNKMLRKTFMDQFIKQFSSGSALDEGTVDIAGISADYINYAGAINGMETMMIMTAFNTDSAMYAITAMAPTTGVDTAYIDVYFELLESVKIGEATDTEKSETVDTADTVSETASQSNAVRTAKSYLDYSAFSREGLIGQLEYEGFSNEDAAYGADNSDADWMEQAVKCAESYLDYSSFSRQGLIEQLEFEGFTHEQAVYGVDATGL